MYDKVEPWSSDQRQFSNNVDVNGMPRHILDVRRRVTGDERAGDDVDEVHDEGERRYPSRKRIPPFWLEDYSQD